MLIKLAFKKLHLFLHLIAYSFFLTFRERFLNFMFNSNYFSNGYIVIRFKIDKYIALKGSYNALSDYGFKKVRSL